MRYLKVPPILFVFSCEHKFSGQRFSELPGSWKCADGGAEGVAAEAPEVILSAGEAGCVRRDHQGHPDRLSRQLGDRPEPCVVRNFWRNSKSKFDLHTYLGCQ